jgi:hypothetical protein
LVLLVLAVIWAAVLIPPALRARAEGRPGDSISAFHRQLAVLRRTGPLSRGSGMVSKGSVPLPRSTSVVMGGNVRAMNRPSRNRRPVAATRPTPSVARARTLQRRRAVLAALVCGALGTLVLGAIPFLRALWGLHLIVDVLLVAYVGLLIHQRNLAAERDINVHFLPNAVPLDPMVPPERALQLQRSAN